MKGQKFLKITGIIMIAGGVIAAIAGIVALMGLGVLAAMADSTEGIGVLYASCGLAAGGGVIQLIAGIVGVKNSGKPENAGKCIGWGAAVAVLCVVSSVLNLIGGNGLQITSLVLGLVLPALYIYGAVLNKKAMQ